MDYTFYFLKNLKKVKKLNSYFILHVCRIHNSNSSEEDILLSVSDNTGSPVTRQLRLRYHRPVLSTWGAHGPQP